MIRLSNINKNYADGTGVLEVLKDFNLEITTGEMIAIEGPSGSGKTTLLNILGLLDDSYEGEYLLSGKNVSLLSNREKAKMRNNSIGFVLQDYGLINYYSVEENVSVPLMYAGIKSKERKRIIPDILAQLGIEDKIHAMPSTLSGGQKQRVSIARALVNSPDIILADEPTGALDRTTGRDVVDCLKQLNKEQHITVVLVTHDPAVARECDRILTL